MSETKSLETSFAPARRAPGQEIERQVSLFSSDTLSRYLLDTVPVMVTVLNRQRQIVYANEAFLQAVGAGDGAAVAGARPGEALHCVHARETAGGCGTTEFCSTCGAVKAILVSQHGERSVQECRVTQASEVGGRSLDLRVWATPFHFEGEPYTVFAIADVSDTKRRRALEHVFFHDVLNTASVLRGAAGALADMDLSGAVEADDAEVARRLIAGATGRLVEELEAQRDLLQAETEELVAHPREVHSLALLRDVAGAYANHSVAGDRSISVAPGSEDVAFVSDPVLLRRVIGNMVRNGLEASPPGAEVTLSCRDVDGCVLFAVHNWAFMPRDVQLQVFQRSFSTKGAGRGLGTYGMRLLSERYLYGSVSFATSENEGTTFEARYPLIWPGDET